MVDCSLKLELPQWYDLHAHFRQDEIVAPLLQHHLRMGCAGVVAMPNTRPPVAKVFDSDDLPYESIEHYLAALRRAGADEAFEVIVPLYLTRETSTRMIEAGASSGLLRAAKYYPPHGTTGADQGWHLSGFMDNGVFRAMEEAGILLCIHGEEHQMAAEQYFDRHTNAEAFFYRERMPRLLERFPRLRIVAEHLTTQLAVAFVQQAPDTVAASITPQHLIYTVGHLLQGLKYHLYCLPLPKFDADRAALRQAVTATDNGKFFAGTDSAPHTEKWTPCGCAAGCYTGGIAPQLYAQAFEMAGSDLATEEGVNSFRRFLCLNGPRFYGLPIPQDTFLLERAAQEITPLRMAGQEIVPLPVGMEGDGESPVSIPWRCLENDLAG
ncbi:MAG: dihydroorotase [Planctomycetes bacterium]|nr:dihydroorotase [Planctomycetota bacterium]